MKFFFVAVAFLVQSIFSAAAYACSLKGLTQPYASPQNGVFLYEVEVSSKDFLAKSHSRFLRLKKFKSWVQKQVDVDPYFLLERQRAFFKKFPEHLPRYDLILSGKIGKVTPQTCVEDFLMENHLSQFSANTEFEAFIFKRSASDKIKILVHSNNRNYVNADRPIAKAMAKLLASGWRLKTHLHNHPFSFENEYGDVSGTVIPSTPDVNSYLHFHHKHGLKSARILNGFHGITMLKNDFFNL